MAENLEVEDFKKMKLPELKKELQARGLSIKGKKPELLERLQEYMSDAVEDEFQTELENEADEDGDIPEDEEDDILEQEEDDSLAAGDQEDGKETEEEIIQEEEEEAVLQTEVTTPQEVKTKVLITAPVVTKKVDTEEVKPKAVRITGPMTDAERKKLRAEKFQTEDAKKLARAKRFGVSDTNNSTAISTQKKVSPGGGSISVSTEMDKLMKRAERFGTNVAPTAVKAEQQDKLLKRKQRFGAISTVSITSPDDAEAKKKKRAERFGAQ